MASTGRKPRRTHSIDDVLYYFSNKPVDTIETVDSLVIDDWPNGQISVMWIKIVTDAFGSATCVPVMLAKGMNPGKTIGLTAGLHGNEASGIPTIQKMFHSLATLVEDMKGCVIAVPCCNQFGFENSSRFYQDGADLNQCFTNAGIKSNDVDAASQPRSVQFANNLFDKILVHCNIIFDIHTASFGRENSFYVRADMRMQNIARLARLLQPQIIVHSACTGADEGEGTLRAACTANGIDCLAIQIGECLSFDRELIIRTYTGIGRVLHHLNIAYLFEYQDLDEKLPPTVICTHSYWIHTTHGGILVIGPKVGDRVSKGHFLASVVDIFGFVLRKFYCPDDGIIVGRSTNPSNVQGDLIIHLGIVADPSTYSDDGTVQIPENISNRFLHHSLIH